MNQGAFKKIFRTLITEINETQAESTHGFSVVDVICDVLNDYNYIAKYNSTEGRWEIYE